MFQKIAKFTWNPFSSFWHEKRKRTETTVLLWVHQKAVFFPQNNSSDFLGANGDDDEFLESNTWINKCSTYPSSGKRGSVQTQTILRTDTLVPTITAF
jgi:hypothetical protein